MMTKTNAYSVLCVFIRTFALWMMASSVVNLPAVVVSSHQSRTGDFTTIGLIISAVVVAFAVLLWIFADKVAKLALARPQQNVFESDIAPAEWQSLAFAVVGAWQTFEGLVALSTHFVALIANGIFSDGSPPGYFFLQDYRLVGAILRLLLGCALLFGARGLVGLLRRYRQVGYAHPDATEASDSSEASSTKPGPTPPE
ncbi:MAG TPA: hypothetical protein VGT79_02310 [Xanthomonadaceae bacterium]|nr:hypothetical protein [Xanthomonadaceae bacterium]